MSDDPRTGGRPARSGPDNIERRDDRAWFNPAIALAGVAVILAVFALVLLNTALRELNTAAQQTERALAGIQERLSGEDVTKGFGAIVASLDTIADRLSAAAPGEPPDVVTPTAADLRSGGDANDTPFVEEARAFIEFLLGEGADIAASRAEFVESMLQQFTATLTAEAATAVADIVRAMAGLAYDAAACGISDAHCPSAERMALMTIAGSLARLEAKLPDPAAVEGLAALPKAVADTGAALEAIEAVLSAAGADLATALAQTQGGMAAIAEGLARIEGRLPRDGANIESAIADAGTRIGAVAEALSRIEGRLPAADGSLNERIAAVGTGIDQVNGTLGAAIVGIGARLAELRDVVREAGSTIDIADKEGIATLVGGVEKIETVLGAIKDRIPDEFPAARQGGSAFEALLTVHFDSNSAKDGGSLEEFILPEIARMTQSRSDCRMFVMGHTDTVGSDPQNYALAERRAESVIDKLKAAFGTIPVEPRGWGERHLAVATDDKTESLSNRRVDINLRCEPE